MNPKFIRSTLGVLSLSSLLALQACDRTGEGSVSTTPGATVPASAPQPASAASRVGVVPAVVEAGGGTSPPDFTALVETVGPAVVNVTTRQTLRTAAGARGPVEDPMQEFLRRFMPMPPPEQREFRGGGVGSGFIISADGHILTNAHVVAGADQVIVRLADSKREYPARVIGADPQTDVALLKVEATGLPVVKLGASKQLRAGEWVAAIGSPFGFANTITAGIVSAKERALPDETYVPFIQTDVAVNPGNSGGPLLNTRGEVVGINSQIYSRTGGYMGVSFAIPIDVAMQVGEQLRTKGRVIRGRLGVGIQEVTSELARSFGLQQARGALVNEVEPGSPAQQAGLAAGDVILQFNGQPVAEATELPRLVASVAPGTRVAVEVWRAGAARSIDVTVGEMRALAVGTPASAASSPQHRGTGRLGLLVSELPAEGRRALGVPFGLVVEDTSGIRGETALRRGDVIVGVRNEPITSLEDFQRRIASAPAGAPVPLRVRRGEAVLFIPVPLGEGS